jgi:hypothetical protein
MLQAKHRIFTIVRARADFCNIFFLFNFILRRAGPRAHAGRRRLPVPDCHASESESLSRIPSPRYSDVAEASVDLDGERLLETRSPVGGSRRLARAESDTQAEPVNECVRGDWGAGGSLEVGRRTRSSCSPGPSHGYGGRGCVHSSQLSN